MKKFNVLLVCLWLCVPLAAIIGGFHLWWTRSQPDNYDTALEKIVTETPTHGGYGNDPIIQTPRQFTDRQRSQIVITYQLPEEDRLSDIKNQIIQTEDNNWQIQQELKKFQKQLKESQEQVEKLKRDQEYQERQLRTCPRCWMTSNNYYVPVFCQRCGIQGCEVCLTYGAKGRYICQNCRGHWVYTSRDKFMGPRWEWVPE